MKKDDYQDARDRYDAACDSSSEQRKRMLEDLRFSNPTDPQQWDDAVALIRRNDPGGARPTFAFDQTNQYIAQVVNDSRMNKPQIQTVPASSGSDEKVSDALDGLIRQIEYASSASIAYDTAQEHAVRIGLGWLRIVPEVVNPEMNEQEIRIKRVHDPLSIQVDPSFTMPDGSDISFGFVEASMPRAEYHKRYKRKEKKSGNVSDWSSKEKPSDWFSDETVRVCEYFEQVEDKTSNILLDDRELSEKLVGGRSSVTEDEYWDTHKKTGVKMKIGGQFWTTKKRVRWCKLDGDDFLEEPTDFPSRWVPLIPVMGYEIWIEGKRFLCGMVRRMRTGQIAYNMERNAELELMASQPKAPYLVPWESVSEHQQEWASANTSNKAYLPYDHKDAEGNPLPLPSRLAPPNAGTMFQSLGMRGLADLQASIGMFNANLGKQGNETSGIAIKRREQQGDTANFHYVDNLARSMTHAGRIIVDMIPHLYDEDREARVLGLDGKSQPIKITSKGPAFKLKGKQVISINPTTGDYDVRCKVGPAYSSLREEAADSLTKIVQSSPQLMTVLGPMWARMQDWPEAEKISKLLMAMAPPQVQALESQEEEIPPGALAKMQEMQQQLQQAREQLKQLAGALENAAEQHSMTEAQIENLKVDNQIDWFKAQTDRLKVEGSQQIAMQSAMQAAQPAPTAPPPVEDQNNGVIQAVVEQMQAQGEALRSLMARLAGTINAGARTITTRDAL